jgi:hypothetical protein
VIRIVLAGVLWPGLDPAVAANNLHQVLHAGLFVVAWRAALSVWRG